MRLPRGSVQFAAANFGVGFAPQKLLIRSARRMTKEPYNQACSLDVSMSEPRVVAEGPVGDFRWGFFMFPRLYRVRDGRLVLAVHMGDDSTIGIRGQPAYWLSSDKGKTWRLADPAGPQDTEALVTLWDEIPYQPKYPLLPVFMPDGEEVYFLGDRSYSIREFGMPVPIVDKRHDPGWPKKITDVYRLGDLPQELRKGFRLGRKRDKKDWTLTEFEFDLPNAALQVARRDHTADGGWQNTEGVVKPLCSSMDSTLVLPDGSLITAKPMLMFQEDGVLREKMGVYVLRSTDRGRTWIYHATAGYMPELNTPGLSEPDFAIMPNGNIACTLRADKGYNRRFTRALYLSVSDDLGKTWCKPFEVAPISVKPRFMVLGNGIVGLQYGRPGVHLLFCTDGTARSWHTHTVVHGPEGESELAEPFHDTRYRFGCDNAWSVPIGRDRFLIAYSDFLHQDEHGRQRKAIKVREISVTSRETEREASG